MHRNVTVTKMPPTPQRLMVEAEISVQTARALVALLDETVISSCIGQLFGSQAEDEVIEIGRTLKEQGYSSSQRNTLYQAVIETWDS